MEGKREERTTHRWLDAEREQKSGTKEEKEEKRWRERGRKGLAVNRLQL